MAALTQVDASSEASADRLATVGVVPVVVLDRATDAAPLARALVAGGLPVAEVTFRTDAAVEAIAAMAAVPGMYVGAGTVLTASQVDAARAAGAEFVVSPGFSAEVVARCRAVQLPVFPGVATASELQQAFTAGLRTVKFFPAETAGGFPALAALAQPFGMMRFMPTGGIRPATAGPYLGHRAVVAVGGSWMVARNLIDAGRFDEITRLAAEAVSLVAAARTKDK